MKLIAAILLGFSLQLSARSYAQKVTLHARNIPLENIFIQIKQQTGYVFFYNNNLVKDTRPVSIAVKDATVEEVLRLCLKDQPIDFTIEKRTVVLSVKAAPVPAVAPLPPPDIKVTGTVINDATRQPMRGATVAVKGTRHVTTTDESGTFIIDAEKGQVIVVSFVGFLDQEFIAAAGVVFNIELKLKPSSLNDMVVIGYGSVKKSDLTGSVSSIKGSTVSGAGAASFDQALQGKAAGVNVTSNSGLPGGGTTIRIRGIGSINSGNDPLFVVDGMPIGSGPHTANLLNADDIDQIEILKDASAAAIYGSQGANGVILVTTKRGKIGAPQAVFDAYYGIKKLPRTWQPGNSTQFGEVYLLAKKAAGAPLNDIYPYYKPYYSLLDNVDFTKDYTSAQNTLYNALKKDHPASTDWMPALFKTGLVRNYNLSLSGGTEGIRYATSGSYYKEDGIIKTTGFERLTVRFNGDYKVSSKVKAGTNLTVVNSTRKGINPLLPNNQSGGLNFHTDNSILLQAYQIDPMTPIFRTPAEAAAAGGDPNNPYDLYAASLYSDVPNPVAGLGRSNVKYDKFQLLGNAFAEYSIIKDLAFRSSIGINFSSGEENSSLPNYFISASDRNLVNAVKRVNDRGNNWDWINQLTWSRSFGKHALTVMAAMDASHYSYQTVTASKSNTPSNAQDLQYLHNAIGNADADDNIQEGALLSYLGRVNYVFNNTYFITGTFRRDGSSSFSPGYRWGNFTSVALGYKISEEKFFKQLGIDAISLLKLRGSWGQLGNSSVPAYSNVSLYNGTSHVSYPFGPVTPYSGGGIANYPYQTLVQGVVPYQIGNPALKWETQEQTNAGIDLSLFANKVTLTADYFVRTTKDNLLQVPVPPNVGYAYALPYSNSGKLQNKGFEFAGEYRNRIAGVDLSLGGNISFVRNKVISLGNEDASYQHYGRRFTGVPYRTIAGHPIADFFGFQTEGIFQSQADIYNYKGKNGAVLQPNAKPGDFKYANLKNDDVLDDSDKVVLGSPLPKYTFGFNIGLGYKGFDLDIYFQGQHGNKILMYEKYFIYRGQGNSNTIQGLPERSWHGPGTSNSQPRITASDPNDNFRMSDYYLEDGSYMRLKMLQLGYNLPMTVCKSLKLVTVRLYVSAENLLTVTHYPGIDPELASTDIQNMGFSSFEYPQPRTLRCGIKVGF